MIHSDAATLPGLRRPQVLQGEHVPNGMSAYCRKPLVDEVLAALAQGQNLGVVLVGTYGTGKTYLARQALDRLDGQAFVVQIRGSSAADAMPYGALSSLLCELDEDLVTSPLAVLRGITQLLRRRADGKSILVFVDNVQDLDELAAVVLTQLAANGTVQLVVTCQDLPKAPRGIVGLWKDGLLHRVDVRPFSQPDVAQWLEATLGGPVSLACSEVLYNASGGNPRFLEAILHEQTRAATLVHSDGVWVLTGKPLAYSRTMTDTVFTALSSISAAEKHVTEVLALAGTLTLDHLISVSDPAAIDALQQRGYLTVVHGDPSSVSLTNALMANVVRKEVPAGRSRELLAGVVACADFSVMPPSAELSLAAWAADCGMQLEADKALYAAGLANRAGNPALALRLIDLLHDPAGRVAAVAEKIRALIGLGELVKARNLALDPAAVAEAPLRRWVDIMLLRSALLCSDDRPEADPRAPLDEVHARLKAEESGSDPDAHGLLDMREELSLAQAQVAVHDGRYREALSGLTRLVDGAPSTEGRTLAASLLAALLALTGRGAEASSLMRSVRASRSEIDVPLPMHTLPASALLGLLPAASTAHDAAAVAAGSNIFLAAHGATSRELGTGVLDAYCGRSEQALERLIPALSQLKQLDPDSTSALGAASIAYAYALLGEKDLALEYLQTSQREQKRTSRWVLSVCSYFQLLTSAELASKEKAIVRLFGLADEARSRHATALELMFLSAAVRLGSNGGTERLVAVASSVQSTLGRQCEAYGTGVIKRNSSALLEVAREAATAGNVVFARDAARAALKIANDASDRNAIRAAQQLIRGGAPAAAGGGHASLGEGQLTAREHEVAAMAAAGVSNKDIAAKMHISVRTVEGHLYQIYGKLQVTSRAELRESFA
ncbi:LuxR C-terminal-related transcriptional regulator [Arthrobacter sp.]|uniref:LuxR C-terminal-related transcriptional regulator n=1 Tax=Arthrobacter sp. TaxID=1667 RepID=UPI002810FDD6|nr:LuxR C-terminal-related transcriptional regulator [Arthrobacter sp.]